MCERLTTMTDAAVANDGVTVGTQASLVCPPTQMFIDGKNQKHVECMPNGLWSDIISECDGMLILL